MEHIATKITLLNCQLHSSVSTLQVTRAGHCSSRLKVQLQATRSLHKGFCAIAPPHGSRGIFWNYPQWRLETGNTKVKLVNLWCYWTLNYLFMNKLSQQPSITVRVIYRSLTAAVTTYDPSSRALLRAHRLTVRFKLRFQLMRPKRCYLERAVNTACTLFISFSTLLVLRDMAGCFGRTSSIFTRSINSQSPPTTTSLCPADHKFQLAKRGRAKSNVVPSLVLAQHVHVHVWWTWLWDNTPHFGRRENERKSLL